MTRLKNILMTMTAVLMVFSGREIASLTNMSRFLPTTSGSPRAAAATIVRFTRAGVLEVINSSFVLYARAMGVPWSLIVWKYVLRNALISTVTQIGLIFGVFLSGAVVVETVFDWPGIGAYAVNSILQSDYKAIMGFTIWTGALFVFVNLITDIMHTLIDPRSSR